MQYPPTGAGVQVMQCVSAALDSGVLTITLSRPGEGNAINARMSAEMAALLRGIAVDDAVRVVVLRGAGKDFSLGMEARDFHADTDTDADTPTLRARRDLATEWRTRLLRLLPQPVIAMVHGRCRGGALAIVENADIVFTATDAAFRATDADADIDGEQAERSGLATCGFAPAELEANTYELARELADKDAIAVRFTKETLEHVGSMTWDATLSFTAAKFAQLKALQAGRPSARATAVESFLAGKSKPGLGG